MKFDYSGKDNLDIMANAVNYNGAIYKWLASGVSERNKVLEFGAGKGEFCNRFNARLTAVELDEDMHRYLKCRALNSLSGLYSEFDYIYSVNVLEHVADDESIVRQLYALLKKNGRMRVLVPARQELYSVMDEKVGHLRRYSKKGLLALFEKNGFRVVSCRYFDSIGYVTTLLFKLLNKSQAFNVRSLILYDRLIFPLSSAIDFITAGRIVGKNLLIEVVK